MRFIPTRIHGVLDYLSGLLLIASPYIFGFADGTIIQWLPQVLGLAAIFYAVFTDYELGLVRAMPMRVHLVLDIASGALLAASPWLFGFDHIAFWPHVVLGLFEIAAGLTTRTTPGTMAVTAGAGNSLTGDL
jgi:hypothetical protein